MFIYLCLFTFVGTTTGQLMAMVFVVDVVLYLSPSVRREVKELSGLLLLLLRFYLRRNNERSRNCLGCCCCCCYYVFIYVGMTKGRGIVTFVDVDVVTYLSTSVWREVEELSGLLLLLLLLMMLLSIYFHRYDDRPRNCDGCWGCCCVFTSVGMTGGRGIIRVVVVTMDQLRQAMGWNLPKTT